MFRVGLTGGVASGKSTISQLFENLGITVIDTDKISHRLMQPGQPGYQEVLAHFGAGILNDDQSINRPQLRKIIFSDSRERSWLEQLLHPLIRQNAEKAIQQAKNTDYVLLVVPLLFETGFEQLLDHIIAIDCPAAVQKYRLMKRDGIEASLAEQMLSAQFNNEQRLAKADSVLHNTDDSDRSDEVLQLHKRLLQLAQTSDN